MSLFDFLKKKNLDNSLTKKSIGLKESNGNLDYSSIHPDIENLLWFGEGRRKNYSKSQDFDNIFENLGIFVNISFLNKDEPSIIYPKLPISVPSDINKVERLPYFPTYVGLTPEQRWVYHKYLSNPYDPDIDLGYVFILYYGLERHLISGNLDEAFHVVLKMRDVYNNKSFQSYSANALITSLIFQRGDLATKFLDSLDKEFEYEFSDNLFLLFFFGLNLPINSHDIMRMSKSFGFTKQNYIKNYPNLFEKTLTTNLMDNTGSSKIYLSDYINDSKKNKMPQMDISIFANISISYKFNGLPLLNENLSLKSEMYKYLYETHEDVKKKLADLRKQGVNFKEESKDIKPTKKELIFDSNREKELLTNLNSSNSFVDKHFAYMNIHEFYYKHRDLDEKYLDKCVEYCWMDINDLDKMNAEYISQRKSEIQESLLNLKGLPEENTNFLKQEKIDIEKYGFKGRIISFERLAIYYEKIKDTEEAINVCDLAIKYYKDQDFGFIKRRKRLLNKLS
jgi:hypothetical protein